ncbi:MAG: M28 family metallopeptidase [Acidobacteriota bacterium]|nr:M28 family metallopeptidase [Acidobacteriota bacterium]
MARLITLLICALVMQGAGPTIRYNTLPQPKIEERLRAFEKKNELREAKLHALFEEAGCPAERLTEQPVKHAKAPNVMCAMPGASERTIIVGAHFDFVDTGSGVVDNWSGAALLPSLFESLKANPRRHNFLFISFTDEEKGLVGSAFYAGHLDKEELKRISAMVNIDSVGTGETKVEITRGNKALLDHLATVAQFFKLPLGVVNVHAVGRSDSDSFQDRKVPAIAVHSLTQETFPILHTRKDQMDAIKMNDYYLTYRLMAAYLAYLDEILDPDPVGQVSNLQADY